MSKKPTRPHSLVKSIHTQTTSDKLSEKDKKIYDVALAPETLVQQSRRMVAEVGDEIAANVRKSLLKRKNIKASIKK